MPEPLHHVFYVSRSLATPLQVEDILSNARVRNAQRKVTGSLVFTGGHFAQLLEGPTLAVTDTMAAITADARHEAVTTLADGAVPSRRFAAWTMGYAEAPGADDLLSSLLGAVPSRERAQRLLGLLFKP